MGNETCGGGVGGGCDVVGGGLPSFLEMRKIKPRLNLLDEQFLKSFPVPRRRYIVLFETIWFTL